MAHVRVAARAAQGARGSGASSTFPLRQGLVQFGLPAVIDALDWSGTLVLTGPDGRVAVPLPGLRWTNGGPRLTGEAAAYFKLVVNGLAFGNANGGAQIRGLSLRLTGAGARFLNRSLRIDVFSRSYPFADLAADVAAPVGTHGARR